MSDNGVWAVDHLMTGVPIKGEEMVRTGLDSLNFLAGLYQDTIKMEAIGYMNMVVNKLTNDAGKFTRKRDAAKRKGYLLAASELKVHISNLHPQRFILKR